MERGVRTMVDLTPINLGRDITVIRDVAERTGAQMIAATGFYWTEEPWFQGWEIDRLVERSCRTSRTASRAPRPRRHHQGRDRPPRRDRAQQKLLQVAARLHRATGVPISTHTSVHHHVGLGQQDVFAEEGVDLSRVVIGHCGDTEDVEHLEQILRRGSTIGMDRFGLDFMLPMEKRVARSRRSASAAGRSRWCLSHDACCHIDWFSKRWCSSSRRAGASVTYPTTSVPALAGRGRVGGGQSGR
jgi:phosphotriesterase-related protein